MSWVRRRDSSTLSVCDSLPFLDVKLNCSQLHNSEQSTDSRSHRRVEDASHRPDTYNTVPFVVAGETSAGKNSLTNFIARTQMATMSPDAMSIRSPAISSFTVCGPWLFICVNLFGSQSRSSDPTAALCRIDTCNIVIAGETGAGKSSLVNLITTMQTATTSQDTTGCTTEPTVYEHDVVVQNKSIKVQLFDTAGQCISSHYVEVTEQDRRSW
jgi:tRNA U34 5-carboxymethylaminomethyl modifying GTPase MnmE/TrmE